MFAAVQIDKNGLIKVTPVFSKSLVFRVTTVKPLTNAVAAIKASRSERGSGICNLAQTKATLYQPAIFGQQKQV